MKYRISVAMMLLYVVAFLQANPLAVIRPFGIRMLLPLAVTVVTGLLRGPLESVLMGFLYGMSMDMLMGRTLGLHAVMYAAVAGLISLVNEKLYREKIFIQAAFSLISVLVTEVMFYLFVFLLRGYSSFGTMFVAVILPTALCNSLLILPLYRPFAAIYARLDVLDRKRNRIG